MVRSLFLVACFYNGEHCGAIYEIEIGDGGAKFIDPPRKLFTCFEERCKTVVDCDMIGSEICLMASYRPLDMHKFIPFEPLVFKTDAKVLMELPMPKAKKPYPRVMAVHGRGFYVLASDTRCSGILTKSPSFERLDHPKGYWDSSPILPEYRAEEIGSMFVSGRAVIGDNILISVVSLFSSTTTEFHCYKVGSSMEEWQVVEKEEKGVTYYYFDGTAACVDDSVFFLVDCCLLVAFSVRFSRGGIIQSLSAPRIITRLHSPMFPEDRYTSCLVHLGNREFCVARTEFDLRSRSKVQYVTIITLKISESMEPVILSSDDCALNTDGLGYAQLTSLCFNSQRSQYDYKSECRTGLKDHSECLMHRCIYTPLQPMNIDPPKLESVPEGSQPAIKRVGSSTSVSGKRNKEIALI